MAQPSFIDGLTIKADYINIELSDAINSVSLEANLESCYDSDPSAFAGNPSCNTFTRDGANQVVDFISGQTNADSFETEFFNFEADYSFELADALGRLNSNASGNDLGEISLLARAFHVIDRTIILNGVTQDNTVGGFADPEWSGTFDITWDRGPARFFSRTFWTDDILFSPSGNNFFADENDNLISSVDGAVTTNVSFSYDFADRMGRDKPVVFQVNVDNVFDREPGRGPGPLLRELWSD